MSSHNPAQRHILERIKAREITPEQGVALLRQAANDTGEPTRDVLQQLKSGAVNPQQALALLRNQLALKIDNQAAENDELPANTALSSGHQQVSSQPSVPHPPIAVVGMSGRFPGAENLDQYWHNLRQGKVSVSEVPAARWEADKYYDPQPQTPGKSPSKWGGFLEDISSFDPLFFSLSPREAELMDPAQRLFLTTTWRALEHAGLAGDRISRERCGVFVGCGPSDYLPYLQQRGVSLDAAAFLGNSNPIMAARIAFLLNLHGPAMAIDTACSSSLVAVQLACESLASGSSSVAIAGGVSVFVTPQTHLLSGAAGMLSPTGRCYTFDARADGIAPAEGVGVVILKTLADAQRDGDRIHGVIVASGLNQDGKSNGITAPSATSQAALQSRIYERFGIDPRQISLLEAHGTGTRLGDPIEISALTDAFGQATAERQFCGIGSVKANIGHASAAAGIAGLLKLLLCLRHREMVPLAGFTQANPHIDFANSPFYPIEKATPWSSASNAPRMAALNSFGFSGTNAHLVLSEAPQTAPASVEPLPASRWLFPLSAREPEALTQIASDLLQWLEDHPTVPLADLAYSLTRRPVYRHRSAIFTDDRLALHGFLSQLSKAQSPQVTSEHAQAFIDSGKAIWRGSKAALLDLPGYPLEEKAYWVPQELAQSSRLTLAPSHPLLEQVDVADGLRFTSVLRAEAPLLRDHQVQGRRILPGVVYLEMAIAAARALMPSQSWTIDDLVWLAPLQVNDVAVTLHLHLQRSDSGFTFEFRSETVASALCKGRLSTQQETQADAPFDITALMSQCPQQRDRAAVQQFFQRHDISYGPSFQSLVQHHAGKDINVGSLELAQPSATHGCYHLDPFLADAALQSAALLFADTASGPLLPSSLQRLQVYKPLPQKLLACAKRTGPLRFDLALLDEAGNLSARFENVGLRKAAKLDQDTLRCFAETPAMPAASDDDQAFLKAFADFEALIPARLSNCLDLATLDAIDILPRYTRLTRVLRHMLTDTNPQLEPQQVEARKAQLCQKSPALRPFVRLLWDCTAALPSILSGQKDATAVLFPSGSAADIAGIYSGNPPADRFHLALSAAVKQAVRERVDQPLRILEIGAGTGATTAIVLDALRPFKDRLTYTFSDISPGFLRAAQSQFSDDATWLDFQLLDLEQPSTAQGFNPQSYDIVIAANVVHATRDIKASLQAIHQLLKPGGLLLLNELTGVTAFGTLTFGLTDGWWRFEDSNLRLEDAPLLAESSWQAILSACGFADFNAFGRGWCGSGKLDQRLMTAVVGHAQQAELVPQTEPAQANQQPLQQHAKQQMLAPDTGTRDDDIRYVSEILADILKLQPQQLVPDRSLDEYGVDSLVTQQIVTAFAADFGELPATLVFEYPSIAKLAGFLRDTQPQALDRAIKARFPTQAAAPLFASKPETAALARPAQPHTKPNTQEDIAIIGLAGRYPMAPDVDTFWQNLVAGRDCISKVPKDRWNATDHATPSGHGDTSHAGFIEDVDCFDARFFHISPREADSMDPQERLFLETAWATIEHAGYDPLSLGKQQRIGVFAGVMNSTYAALAASQAGQTGSHRAQTAYWSVANRVSFYLDFRGPSMAVDSACSSSLTAIHLACASIARGECEMALAGGVNLILDPSHLACLAEMRMLSPSAKCHAFGQGADGFVDGEGVGAVLLAPLSKAVTDGAHILAVIKGSAINSGGRTTGFTVPSPEAQGEVVREAIVNAGIEPESLDYVEAHGTGTALGDPIEIAGLRTAFRKLARNQSCAVGSVKSNIGHLESAAGIASLTKVLKQLQHGRLAPSLHADQLNTKIDLKDKLFHIQRESTTWSRPQLEVDGQMQQLPRCAGISSFGAGGANAHLVVTEYKPEQATRYLPQGEMLIPLSARTQDRLDKQIEQLLTALADSRFTLADLAFTLQTGRTPMQVRGVVVASDQVTLQQRLQVLHSSAYSASTPHVWRSQSDQPQQHHITFSSQSDVQNVAALWVQGATVDWLHYWQSFDGKRVPLPTYPFERTRHWLKTAKTQQPQATSVSASLLGEVDPLASLSDGLTWRLNLSDTDPLASEHRVNGQGIYPAAAQLCLLHEAWARVGRVGAMQLQNVTWAQPLTATSDAQLTLKQQGEGLAFQIKTAKSTISSGLCLPAASQIAHLALPGLSALQARFTTMQNPAEIYAALHVIGIEHGAPYQVMRHFASKTNETLAELECTSSSDGWSPYLVDGLMQTVAAIGELERKPMLPYRVEAVHFFAAPQPRCWAYAQKISDTSFRLVLFGQDGTPLLVMDQLEARPLPSVPNYWSYTPHWTRHAVSATTGDTEKINAVIYATPAKALAEHIAHTSGDAETELLPWPGDSDAWQALIQSGKQAPKVVLFIPEDDTSGTQGLLHLCQGLVKAGYGRDRVAVHVVTRRACAVTQGDAVSAFAAACHGFVASAAREFPDWRWSLHDLDTWNTADQVPLAFDSAPSDKPLTVLARRHGYDFRRILRPTRLPSLTGSPYKTGGVYVIAGGNGGIGQALALDLAQRFKAKLVLLGRSQATDALKQTLAAIADHGGEAIYQRTDLTDQVQVEAAIATASAQFGKINGVFHTALVLRDCRIVNMSLQDLNAALAPKVAGTIHLHLAVKDHDLDFMCLFSSAQSFLGNAGQANYAAASTFMDARAHDLQQRSNYAVRVFNWGFWSEVGSVATPEYRKRLNQMGILPLSTREGLAMCEQALAAPATQIVPFKAEPRFLKSLNMVAEQAYQLQPMPQQNVSLKGFTQAIQHQPVDAQQRQKLDQVADGLAALDRVSAQVFAAALMQIQAAKPGDPFVMPTMVIAQQQRLVNAALPLLAKFDLLQRLADDSYIWGEPTTPNTDALLQRFPDLAAYTQLLLNVAPHYAAILCGQKQATDVLFPAGSLTAATGIYRGNALSDGLNTYAATAAKRFLSDHCPTDRTLHVLEIGGGTGGTTDAVLPQLSDLGKRVSYHFTDIGRRFVLEAEKRLASSYPFVQFDTLDIEKPKLQIRCDVVVAANVLHATSDIRQTLDHVRGLLRPGGLLILNEVTAVSPFATFTFGLLEGWQRHQDNLRLPSSPLLHVQGWQALLKEQGFLDARALGFEGLDQHIILAQNGPCYLEDQASAKQVPEPPSRPKVQIQAQPAKADLQAHKRLIEQQIVSVMARTLEVAPDELQPDLPHAEFGLDSILAMEVIEHLNQAHGWEMSPTDLFNYATIRDLAEHLATTLEAPIIEPANLTPADRDMLDILEQWQAGSLTETDMNRLIED